MAHQLAVLCHEYILQVFLDVQKSYDSLERGRHMDILRVYGLVPNLQRLLKRLWDDQVVVPKAGKLFGVLFRMEIGVTQGDLISPTIFNILMEAVVRAVLLEVFGPQ